MKLLKQVKIKKATKKRKGRGYGSGKGGHTIGKGMKGQSSRSGFKKLRAWVRESNVKSLPKLRGVGKRSALRGYFKARVKSHTLNVGNLDSFSSGDVVNKDFLFKKGLLKSKGVSVKILGNGEISKKITVKGIYVTKNAKKKIEKAGGKVV